MAAKIIVIEGIDGSGKDTVINNLTTFMEEKGYKYSVFGSLSGKELGPLVRNKLSDKETNKKQLTSLFIAELFEVEEAIKKRIDVDDYIICNRWIYSTMAYNANSLAEMNAIMLLSDTDVQVDFIFYLDLPVDTAINRLKQTGKNLEIFENKESLEKVKENYETISNIRSINNFYKIDADREPLVIATDIKYKIFNELIRRN